MQLEKEITRIKEGATRSLGRLCFHFFLGADFDCSVYLLPPVRTQFLVISLPIKRQKSLQYVQWWLMKPAVVISQMQDMKCRVLKTVLQEP